MRSRRATEQVVGLFDQPHLTFRRPLNEPPVAPPRVIQVVKRANIINVIEKLKFLSDLSQSLFHQSFVIGCKNPKGAIFSLLAHEGRQRGDEAVYRAWP